LRDVALKMAERKTKRNARTPKTRRGFRICREPIVRVAAEARLPDVTDSAGLPRVYGWPIMFAIAQNARTIFANWNIDWPSVFGKATPVDRQVHLRLIGRNGLEEKKLAVEPMVTMRFIPTSGPHHFYRVEIGYYQPGGVWRSVAMSNEVEMPLEESAELADMDLATIPVHLSFQHLLDVFGATNATPLARVVSKFQKRVLCSKGSNKLTPNDAKILRKLNLSLPAMAVAHSDFEKSDTAKLARRRRTLLQFPGTSPSRTL
jgi:Domain of unknown function (DUF4912)